MRRRRIVSVALAAAALGIAPAGAAAGLDGELHDGAAGSLPHVESGRLPGPAVLYDDAPSAPMLENHHEAFEAETLRISGAQAYVGHEYLYSDFLYDDTGDGGATYPGDRGRYADNGADLVEFRVAVDQDAVHYRLTLNTLLVEDAAIAAIAFDTDGDPATGTDELPGDPGAPFPGTDEVITLWGAGAAHHAFDADGAVVATTDLDGEVHLEANQLTVTVPRDVSDPQGVWQTTVAVGVNDPDAPGDWLPYDGQRAIYNVAFRFDEPITHAASPPDSAQADALGADDPTRFATPIDFDLLASGEGDLSGIPTTGTMVRFFPSRLELGEGRAAAGFPEWLGQLQPYSLYVPSDHADDAPSGFTLNLHSLGQSYWQYNGSEGVRQLGEQRSHVVATPHARGTDGWYQHEAEYDVFEVWNDVARHVALDPDRASSAGYSMGGYGTYRLATRYPDLFGTAMTTVGPPGDGIWAPPAPPTGGAETLSNLWLENARNVPYLNVVGAADELVPYAGTTVHNTGAGTLAHGLVRDVRRQLADGAEELSALTGALGDLTAQLRGLDDAAGLQSFEGLGYRYVYRTYPAGEHFTLALLDYDVPGAAEFLGEGKVDRSPAHVTFAAVPGADAPDLGLVADGAYWVADVRLADADGDTAKGVVDAFSHGHGRTQPEPLRHTDAGNGPAVLPWLEVGLAWTDPEATAPVNLLEVTLDNAAGATVDLDRAALDPAQPLRVDVVADTAAELLLVGAFPAGTEVLRDGEPVGDAGPDGARLPVAPGAQTFALQPGDGDGEGGDGEDPDEGAGRPGDHGRDRADDAAGERGSHGREQTGGAAPPRGRDESGGPVGVDAELARTTTHGASDLAGLSGLLALAAILVAATSWPVSASARARGARRR